MVSNFFKNSNINTVLINPLGEIVYIFFSFVFLKHVYISVLYLGHYGQAIPELFLNPHRRLVNVLQKCGVNCEEMFQL